MLRVLIVDDDFLTRKGLRTLMPWEQHDMCVVGEAENGREALDFLTNNANNQVDLVFTDIDMPVMDGIAFIQTAMEIYPDIDFVVLTVHDEFNHVQQALRLGAIDYLPKTQFDSENFDAILDRINKSVAKRAQRQTKVQPQKNVQSSFELPESASKYSGDIVKSILEIKSLVDSNYKDAPDTAQAAEAAHMSYGYFCRSYKDICGMTYNDYCTDVRIHEAEHLLESTDMTVQQIAYEVGYNDEKYFSRTFKKLMGKAPSEWRRGKIKSPTN